MKTYAAMPSAVDRAIAFIERNTRHPIKVVGDGYWGPAFIRRFHKGQVLYGSCRSCLKKVAMADWDTT